LRSKCAEVEENDDRFIECAFSWLQSMESLSHRFPRLLKDKKQLTSKIASLSRKVQTLQKKLADAKSSIIVPSSQADVVLPAARTSPTIDNPSTRAASSSAPAAHNLFPSTRAPVSLDQADLINTPNNRTRAISGPSSLPRPKTPERKMTQPVLRPTTPERRRSRGTTPDTGLPSSGTMGPLIGKKRPPPEEFESLPPQGFTPDSLPAYSAPVDGSTPRARKVIPSAHSGFTPVRHGSARPTLPLPSPRRRAGLPRETLIADVTNNPRPLASVETETSKPAKRSWLGKIRGGSAHAPGRTASSLSTFAERTAVMS
jgi:hypothetical protein